MSPRTISLLLLLVGICLLAGTSATRLQMPKVYQADPEPPVLLHRSSPYKPNPAEANEQFAPPPHLSSGKKYLRQVMHPLSNEKKPILMPNLDEDIANATLILEESLFKKVTNDALPVIIAFAKGFTVPGESEKHFSFSSFKLSEVNIQGLAITFAAPDVIKLSVQGLSIAVPQTSFSVFTHILNEKDFKISCSGDFWASASGTNIDLSMAVADVGGKLQVKSVTPYVHFGSLNVGHKFHNFFCKVAQSIVQLFIGSINSKLENLIKKELPSKMAEIVEKKMNEVFQKIPYPLLGDPVINSRGVALSVNLIAPTTEVLEPASTTDESKEDEKESKVETTGNEVSSTTARDAELIMDDHSVTELFTYLYHKGKLVFNHTFEKVTTSELKKYLPGAYKLCPKCPLAAELHAQQSPVFHFNGGAATLEADRFFVGLSAINTNATTKKNVPLVDFGLNLTFAVENFTIIGANKNTIKFLIELPSFSLSVYKSYIGPIDGSLLTSILNFVLKDVLVPEFNKKFKGYTIPTKDGVSITDVLISFSHDEMTLGLDVNLPPLV